MKIKKSLSRGLYIVIIYMWKVWSLQITGKIFSSNLVWYKPYKYRSLFRRKVKQGYVKKIANINK